MAEEKDRIQRAAEALDALGASPPRDEQAEQPALPILPPAPDPAAPKDKPPAASPGAAPPVHVTLRKLGKLQPAPKPEKPKKAEPPPPPPPPLTPLAKATLARKIAFRRTAIPVLLVSGLGMVLLGCWAIGVLAFDKDLLKGEVTFPARNLAKMMLLAWPIGAILLGGAVLLMYDVYQSCQTQLAQPPPAGKPEA